VKFFLLIFITFAVRTCFAQKLIGSTLFQANSVVLLPKKEALFVFFKENCSSCRRQSREVSCLNIPVYFIGLGAHKKELQKESRRMRNSKIVFVNSDQQIEQRFEIKSHNTPQLYLLRGGLAKKRLGFHTCEQISTMFRNLI
jgi:thioredoxin-related protein